MISLVIFSSPSLFCVCAAYPASHVHFILQIFTARLCGCCQISVLTLFYYQCVYRPKSLAPSVTHYVSSPLFLPPSLFILSRVDVNTRRTLPLPLNHSLFTCPASALFDHLFVDVFSDSCRLSVTMAYLLSPSSTFAHLTMISYFFVSVSQINRNFSSLAPISPCRLMMPVLYYCRFFRPRVYRTETIIF